MAIFIGVAMFADYRSMKKKKKKKRKVGWWLWIVEFLSFKKRFCGGCGEFAGCGLWSFVGRWPIGDLLQTACVGWCWGCGIVWI